MSFTKNLQRHVQCDRIDVEPGSLRDIFDQVFAINPRVRGYVVDDQGAVRKHMAIFVDGEQIIDRVGLSDTVADGAEIYVMQALSGG